MMGTQKEHNIDLVEHEGLLFHMVTYSRYDVPSKML
jgi:hypothetical protein